MFRAALLHLLGYGSNQNVCQQMNKDMAYIYNGMFYSAIKECHPAICSIMGGPREY